MRQFNEIVKEILKKYNFDVTCKHLYHYTDGNGLKGIIENNEFWITERNYMNDVYDEKYVQRYIKSSFGKVINFKGSLLEKMILQHEPQYIFSTSIEKDLIHQWTYYGDTDSYCIEFDRQSLIDLFYSEKEDTDSYYYGPVLYDTDKAKQIITKVMEDYKKEILSEIDRIVPNIENETQVRIAREVYRYFYSLIKQEGHYCEKEYRFLLQTSKQPEFKIKQGLFVPYIKTNQKEHTKLPITKIIIGPNNHEKIATESLRRFLIINKYTEVEIQKSSLSIR